MSTSSGPRAPVGSFEYQVGADSMTWSDDLFALFGVDPQDFEPSADTFIDLLHPNDRARYRASLESTIATGRHLKCEFQAQLADGNWHHFEAVGSVVRDVGGAIAGIRGTVQDITDRKRADEALRDSEIRSRTLLEGSPVCNKIIDLDSRLLYMSTAGQQRLKIANVERFYGTTYPPEFFPEESRAALTEHLSRSKKGETCSLECRMMDTEGEEVWYHTTFVPAKDREGHIEYIIASSVDITARKMAEEALRKSEIRSRTLLEGSPVCNKIIDLDSRLLYMSTAGQERLKIADVERFYGSTYPPDFFPEESRAALTEHLNRAKKGETCSLECRMLDTEGEEVWYHTTFVPAKDREGRIQYIIASSVEITARKKAEAERKLLESQLRHSQKMEAVGQLAGGVAHDFNNLLTVILGNAALLRASLSHESNLVASEQLLDALGKVDSAAKQGAQLTRQLLAFSRQEINQRQVVDAKKTLRDMKGLIASLIGEHIQLRVLLDEASCCVYANPGQIEQVVLNLVVNATDSMPDGGRLDISITRRASIPRGSGPMANPVSGPHVVLSFQDNGNGMSASTRERIFEPFFTTKPDGKGTGLGLATVYGVVKQLNGDIEVESETGKGALFTVTIPATDQSATEAERIEPPLRACDGETVLVCEDKELVRNIMCAPLRAAGYEVFEAENGRHALEVADACGRPIDLLISDVVMPELNGIKAANALRNKHRDLRVLFVSGYTADHLNAFGLNETGTQLLQKPFEMPELLRRVRCVLDDAPDPIRLSLGDHSD